MSMKFTVGCLVASIATGVGIGQHNLIDDFQYGRIMTGTGTQSDGTTKVSSLDYGARTRTNKYLQGRARERTTNTRSADMKVAFNNRLSSRARSQFRVGNSDPWITLVSRASRAADTSANDSVLGSTNFIYGCHFNPSHAYEEDYRNITELLKDPTTGVPTDATG